VVSKRSRSILICSRSAPYFWLEFTNHPVCAAKERDLLLMAQPPLLEKEGNGAVTTPELISVAIFISSPKVRFIHTFGQIWRTDTDDSRGELFLHFRCHFYLKAIVE